MRVAQAALALACLGSAALAEAPARSPLPLARPTPAPVLTGDATGPAADPRLAAFRPRPRPEATASAAADLPDPWYDAGLANRRPRLRPEAMVVVVAPAILPSAMVDLAATDGPLTSSPHPMPRPEAEARVTLAAFVPVPGGSAFGGRKGNLCGNPALTGSTVPPIVSRVSGCGVARPVRVTAVAGIPLSTPATLDCAAADALADWVQAGLLPAVGRSGGGLARINVVDSYSCRPRNNQPGARISEHAKGNALDISGITLKNGTTLTVLRDWRSAAGTMLRTAYRAACGTFGTTLGPGSDGFHENHMHLDVAHYRGGAYCR